MKAKRKLTKIPAPQTPRIVFVTLALDAMPFITRHLSEFEKLELEWEWRIAEGVAAPKHCTKWCAPMTPRLSFDGTTGYLESIAAWDTRVKLMQRELWNGKTHMLNALCHTIREPSLVWEVDADECWNAEQIMRMARMFAEHRVKNCAHFHCRYFVGKDIMITSRGGYGNNEAYEWKRVWRWEPGMRWKSHEPPVVDGITERPFTHAETEAAGLVFDHYAYATEAQVAFKEQYYGSINNECGKLYKDAVKGWMRLQENREWPADLKQYMPWVGDGVRVERV